MAKDKNREPVKMVPKKSKSNNYATPDDITREDNVSLDDSDMMALDDQYEAIQNEFDQIRGCIGMYISYEKTMAALHLMHEIFHNALDEFSNAKSSFDEIHMDFSEKTQTFRIEDWGRGIPFEKLPNVCMKKHVSTKFNREALLFMKRFAGRNGEMIAV